MADSDNDNSLPQLAVFDTAMSYVCQSIQALSTASSHEPVTIANYGSSYGQNSLHAIKNHRVLSIEGEIGSNQAVLVVHNALLINDWSSQFDTLNRDSSY